MKNSRPTHREFPTFPLDQTTFPEWQKRLIASLESRAYFVCFVKMYILIFHEKYLCNKSEKIEEINMFLYNIFKECQENRQEK